MRKKEISYLLIHGWFLSKALSCSILLSWSFILLLNSSWFQSDVGWIVALGSWFIGVNVGSESVLVRNIFDESDGSIFVDNLVASSDLSGSIRRLLARTSLSLVSEGVRWRCYRFGLLYSLGFRYSRLRRMKWCNASILRRSLKK